MGAPTHLVQLAARQVVRAQPSPVVSCPIQLCHTYPRTSTIASPRRRAEQQSTTLTAPVERYTGEVFTDAHPGIVVRARPVRSPDTARWRPRRLEILEALRTTTGTEQDGDVEVADQLGSQTSIKRTCGEMVNRGLARV
jgi:hypothetical protein